MDNYNYYILDIAPLCFIPQSQSPVVSYTYANELKRGSTVEIKYGKKIVEGVVLRSAPLKNNKLILKKINTFELKPINKIISENPQFFEYQLDLALHLSNIAYSPLGLCLKAVSPPFNYKASDINIEHNVAQQNSADQPSKLLFIAIEKDFGHVHTLRAKIKEYIKLGKQVLILAPDENICNLISKILDDLNPIIYTQKSKIKTKREAWDLALNGEAKLFIGTRPIIFLPFNSLGAVIIEDHLDQRYNSISSPIFSAPDLIRYRATKARAGIIYSGFVAPLFPVTDISDPTEISPDEKIEIVDMVAELKNRNFSPISDVALKLLYKTVEESKSILFFSPRRGYATAIGCKVCGKIVRCPKCNHFLKFSITPAEKIICFKCLQSYPPHTCPLCNTKGSLSPIGNGVEKVFDLVSWHANQKFNSDKFSSILLESGEAIPHKEDAKALIATSTQHILSQRALTKFDYAVIVDTDLLMSYPRYDTEEKVLRILKILDVITSDKILAQVYTDGTKKIESLIKDGSGDFRQNEIKVRESLNLPPFGDFIEVYYESNSQDLARTRCIKDFKFIEHELKRLESKILTDPPHKSFEPLKNFSHSYIFALRGTWPSYKDRNRLLSKLNPNAIIRMNNNS